MTLFQPGHAVVIGVGGSDIPNTVDDAAGLAGILVNPERCAYPPAQVQLLTSADAGRQPILAALDQVAKATDSQSMVIVCFSGHGYRVSASIREAYYLIPHGYDLGQLHKTAISGQEFASGNLVVGQCENGEIKGIVIDKIGRWEGTRAHLSLKVKKFKLSKLVGISAVPPREAVSP